MNKSAFLKLIKQVSDISDQQQSELEQVAATFPYCQTAHLLLAKSAYDRGSMLSTQRLRRASAYATDRQLLKRIIYAAPVLEPVYAEEQEELISEETATTLLEAVITEAETTVDTEQSVTRDAESTVAVSDPEEAVQEETLEQVYSPAPFDQSAYLVEDTTEFDTKTPDAEIDSELALLFTFNSISSSSTDLLSQREDESLDEVVEQAHFTEAAEALHDLEQEQQPQLHTFAEEPLDEPDAEAQVIPDLPSESNPENVLADGTPLAEASESNVELFDEDAEEPAQANAEDAEINYSFDEIDRLYAEDALGYWMGSSRLGEVLQLKDDYTRTRPLGFHPELILEYSKTHELEKAIQPTAHVLSKQLDIIDQFLKLNPRLKTMASLKLKPEPQEDLSLKSSKIKKGMATESLANIFIKQGKPKKAAKIYEQLILKYPEKKSYFAEQIEKLQNIT
ncbi:hypothetical protein [Pontibacter amylolyticus]|uniref:Tetratricopeptide repeat protein n=1 Tax=Pontibacter amylolyticus TaxID=1424080 RepID=A0ABQ1WJZ4_9BACT|nr:hypothetical protein [Pontibacter amylolyticus]GGG30084.1 hypothetical protein GCM10011323_36930 [Pontibacter amylolyticus]